LLHGSEHDDLFEAVVDATEEAVVASMLAAPTVVGREGRVVPGLDIDAVRGILTGSARGPDRNGPSRG
jgi:D-aminopeptidase